MVLAKTTGNNWGPQSLSSPLDLLCFAFAYLCLFAFSCVTFFIQRFTSNCYKNVATEREIFIIDHLCKSVAPHLVWPSIFSKWD